MKKLAVFGIAGLMAVSAVATSLDTAEARPRRAGAFALGAIFGAAAGAIIASQARAHRVAPVVWDRHAVWCSRKYRSYNPRNNLFKTRRRGWVPCRSPFWP